MSLFTVNEELCIKCSLCAQVCPSWLISFDEKGFPEILPPNEARCIECGHCVLYCPTEANTLSFMRVAGLGIAHVSLMTAFFQIANMVNPTHGFSIVSLIILIVGNVLVIALEGLSAGIQSLRLNYYEFFSKYFNGTGRAYSPITIKAK